MIRQETKMTDKSKTIDDFKGTKYGYARVSTSEQDLTDQISILRQTVDKKNIFTDKLSGKNGDRPGYRALMNTLSEGDHLYLVKIDRLGRSIATTAGAIEELTKRGVYIREVTTQVDNISSYGETYMNLLGIFAKMERQFIKERTMRGRKIAQEKGVIFGLPPKVNDALLEKAWGYYNDSKLKPKQIYTLLEISRATYYRSVHPYLMERAEREE